MSFICIPPEFSDNFVDFLHLHIVVVHYRPTTKIWAALWQNHNVAVWPEASLSTWRKLGSLATHWVHSKDSDQTGQMPRLIWFFAGRRVILFVLSCRGSNMLLNTTYEPAHEILAIFFLRKLILQTSMCSHPVGLDVWFLVWPFVYFHTSCVRTAKALARLRGCAGLPELSLVAYVVSTIISWAGSYTFLSFSFYPYCYTLSQGLWACVYCTHRFCRKKAYRQSCKLL